MFSEPKPVDRDELRQMALATGVDLVGLAGVAQLEASLPAELRPSTIGDAMVTLVVLGKRTLRGVSWSKHLPSKQLAGGRVVRALEGCAAMHGGRVVSGLGTTPLVIGPGFVPKIVAGVLSGIHEQGESHYELLRAFCSEGALRSAVGAAHQRGYLGEERRAERAQRLRRGRGRGRGRWG